MSNQWNDLLNSGRRKWDSNTKTKTSTTNGSIKEKRTEIERDYDRILFSTPVRRLADKTQVFPLDKNDSVRNRLTHSFEVSNLARSIGTLLVFEYGIAKKTKNNLRNIPAILAAIGLVHDIGNPPFGHQGEAAIQSWFKSNFEVLRCLEKEQQRLDFLNFEGNAQAFRLVTRLQLLNDNFGLDLTYATLASMMKYPTASNAINDKNAATKKHGFFASEQQIATDILHKNGLMLGKRHPLSYVMEACDDIAYVVFDAEDSIKKGLASISDLHAWLTHAGEKKYSKMICDVVKESENKHKEYRDRGDLSPAELNDVSMQRFRVAAIGAMIPAVTNYFVKNEAKFLNGSITTSLIAATEAESLRKALKDFSLKHGYTHKSVLCIELEGYNVIRNLMDMFWVAIVDRKDKNDPCSRRNHPFTRLVYDRISENYRRVFEHPSDDIKEFPMRYRECLLLTDMVSGMTDTFAMDLHKELSLMMGDFNIKEVMKT